MLVSGNARITECAEQNGIYVVPQMMERVVWQRFLCLQVVICRVG